jgi:hypothetical protein
MANDWVNVKQSDTFVDVYEDFKLAYHYGLEPNEIPAVLYQSFEITEDKYDEDYAPFWFAIAYGQWMCKSLQKEVLEIVEEIYNTDRGLEIWAENIKNDDFSKKLYLAHKKSIAKFLETIKKDRSKALKRKKLISYSSYFQLGDCLAIQLSNGYYGGGLVVDINEDNPLDGKTTIAFVNYYALEKPTTENIVNGEILHHDYNNENDGFPDNYAIKEISAKTMKSFLKKINLIGTVSVSEYSQNYLNITYKNIPFMWGLWQMIDEFIIKQIEFDKTRTVFYPKIIAKNLISEGCDDVWKLVSEDYYDSMLRTNLRRKSKNNI